jgi:ABC-type nitrate/sulfonate/bicarbonate transport system permease component
VKLNRSAVIGAISLICVVLVWEAAGHLGKINTSLFPMPSQIAPAVWQLLSSGDFLLPMSQTLEVLFAGIGLACVCGVSLGVAMGVNRTIFALLEPLVEAIRPIPKPALIPALVIFIGIGPAMKVSTVALATLFPILISTLQGVRGVDSVALGTARTLGCSFTQTIWKVILPSALPMILTGVRVSLGMGLSLVILAEMLSSESGVGFLVLDLERSFQVRAMYAWIVLLALVGMILNSVFERFESYATPWRAK